MGRFSQSLTLVFGLALYLALALFSEYWLGVITSHPIGVDFGIYYEAYVDASSGGNPYAPYEIGKSFVNHPFVLSVVSLFSGHRDQGLATTLWLLTSAVLWVVVIWLVLGLLRSGAKEASSRSNGTTFGGLLVVFLAFAPFLETIHIGQINVFAMVSLCLMFYLFEREMPLLAGLFLALSIVLKTSPVIFVLYFVALRQFRLLASCVISLMGLSIVPLMQFSPEVLANFFEVLPLLGSEIRPSRYNQSILSPLSFALSSLGVESARDMLALGHKMALAIVLGLILVPALGRPSTRETRLWAFALLLLTMTLFSPLVWYHHSIFLILPLAFLLLHPDRCYFLVGVGSLLLIQVERLNEFMLTPLTWPVITAGYALLGLGLWVYLSGPAARGSISATPLPPRSANPSGSRHDRAR